MPEEILDTDELARLLLEPKDTFDIVNSVLNLIRITSGNFQFNSTNDNKESVNCLRLFKEDPIPKCHAEGKKKEKSDNDRSQTLAAAKGTSPKVRNYIGYCSANYIEVKSVSDHHVSFEAQHCEEGGNYAHCNIQMHILESLKEKTAKEVSKFKNAAISKLSDKFSKFEKLSP